MKPEEREAWNSRVPVMTVQTLCTDCGTLQPADDVKERVRWYPVHGKQTSCTACFERTTKAMYVEATGE